MVFDVKTYQREWQRAKRALERGLETRGMLYLSRHRLPGRNGHPV